MNRILAALDALASSQPEQIALIDEQRELSYRQLAAEVAELAAWLSAQGLRRLGLWGDNGSRWVVADLAAWRAGVTLVPLPRFFSADQLDHVIASSGLDQLLVCGGIAAPAAVAERRLTPIEGLSLDRLADEGSLAPPIADDICKITFTSGTTGTPKGVCLSSAQLQRVTAALAAIMHDGTDAAVSLDRHFSLLPLTHLRVHIQ